MWPAVAARALAPEPLREDLEEVVSDTFLALWRSRESLDPVRSLRPWLAGDRPESGHRPGQKAAGNGRHSRPSSRQPGRAPKSWRSGTSSTVSSGGWWTAWRSRMTLFRRYYFEEEPLHQVAKELGLNQATARTRLARGRP